jgi:predicted ATPase
MANFILTGTPGSGKTALLRLLERGGHPVVEEAATDVIAVEQALGEPEPWRRPEFTDQIVALQRSRQRAAPSRPGPVFFDRSPVCTLALARYLGRAPSAALTAELDRLAASQFYQPAVFFLRGLGFMTPTSARRISLAEALQFERHHELAYRERGFTLIEVPAAPLTDRAALVAGAASSMCDGRLVQTSGCRRLVPGWRALAW